MDQGSDAHCLSRVQSWGGYGAPASTSRPDRKKQKLSFQRTSGRPAGSLQRTYVPVLVGEETEEAALGPGLLDSAGTCVYSGLDQNQIPEQETQTQE